MSSRAHSHVGVVGTPGLLDRARAVIVDPALLRYVGVGIFNTCLDLGLYSLATAVLHWDPIVANVCSTSITLCVSYWLNRLFVFQSKAGYVTSAVLFVAVTLFSGMLVQSSVIWLSLRAVAKWWPALPVTLAHEGAKILAIGFGMCSNYIGYHWLFRTQPAA